MKKIILKRICTLSLMALLLSIGTLCIFNQAEAASYTQNDTGNWTNSQIEKSLDYDGVYGTQCVDLIKHYYKCLAGVETYGNVCDYAFNVISARWKRMYNGFHVCNVAVWKVNHSCSTCNTGNCGHVGIITYADIVGFNAVNQNFNGRSYCTQNWFNISALQCVIRPDFKSEDTILPTTTNVKVSNITNDGYTVSCTVNDNIGVTRVLFSSWNQDKHTGNDASWITGTISGNTASAIINLSSLKLGDITENYMTHIYAYDIAGNWRCKGISTVTIGNTVAVDFQNQKVNFTQETNVEVYVRIANKKQRLTKVRCYLYNVDDKLLKSYYETCNYTTDYVNYTCNINNDMQYTLASETSYKYFLYAVVSGKEYKDIARTFKTTVKKVLTVLGQVTNISAKADNKSISLIYNQPANTKSFQIQYCTNSFFLWTKQVTTGDISYTLSGLSRKKYYYVRVHVGQWLKIDEMICRKRLDFLLFVVYNIIIIKETELYLHDKRKIFPPVRLEFKAEKLIQEIKIYLYIVCKRCNYYKI